MRLVRKFHLFLSVFFAPLLIFFIGTGWFQTVSTQRNKTLGEQDTWLTKLTSVHVDQIYPNEAAMEYSTTLFKALVVVMSICLLVTIVLGLYLAFKTSRQKWPVWLSLLLGVLLPVVFLWLGQAQ